MQPDIDGPRVRTGVLWFFVALAAVTSGRWWTAALWASVAFVAAVQLVVVWDRHLLGGDRQVEADAGSARREAAPRPASLVRGSLAGAAAVAVTGAAAWSTGLAGLTLVALGSVAALAFLGGASLRRVTAPIVVGMLAPAIASASVVLAVRHDLWSGLFLVLAISLYDAGSFLFGAEATGSWEGPVGGLIGVTAVTFTMSATGVLVLDAPQVWAAGAAVAVGCVVGQLCASALLPTPGTRAGALRRLDTALVAGPLFLSCLWLLDV